MGQVKQKLLSYPQFRLLSEGTIIVASLAGAEPDPSYEVLFTNDRIEMRTYSSKSPAYHMKDSLLRLLSIAALFSDDFKFDISSLFPYLISVLANLELSAAFQAVDTQPQDSRSDIILAKRINELTARCDVLEKEKQGLSEKLSRCVSTLVISESTHSTVNVLELERRLRLSSPESKAAMQAIRAAGYVCKLERGGTLRVVKE